jgi:hypothetical protein
MEGKWGDVIVFWDWKRVVACEQGSGGECGRASRQSPYFRLGWDLVIYELERVHRI